MKQELIYSGNGGLAYGMEMMLKHLDSRQLFKGEQKRFRQAIELFRRRGRNLTANNPHCGYGRLSETYYQMTIKQTAFNPDRFELHCDAAAYDDESGSEHFHFIARAAGVEWGEVEVFHDKDEG